MIKKRNLFIETETTLNGYTDLVDKIDLLRKEIEIMKNEYKGCGGISYEERVNPTNAFNSIVENELINKARLLKEMDRDLNKSIILKNRIDTAVRSLTGADREVIELKYINKRPLTWYQISKVVNFSEVHCRKRIKVRAIKKMINIIFYDAGKQTEFKI